MGDILHALPAVTALRALHPSWKIGWVVDPRWQALLTSPGATSRGAAQPVVDQLHFAPTRKWKRHPLTRETRSEIRQLREAIRSGGYDVVLDLQGAIRSAVIARMSGCRRRVGETHPREWPAQWLFTDRVATTGAHVIEQDFELAAAIAGDDLAQRPPQLPVDTSAETWCDALLASSPAKPLALIAPGAGWGAKRWPADRYAIVAQALAERGYRVFVNAGPAEEQLAAVITAGGAAEALNADLAQLIALTRRIALCIAGDTGPLHLACALARPVVGIYGPTDPSRNGPYGTRSRVLRTPGSKVDHTRHAQPDPSLLTITPDDVLRAVDELLAEERVP